MMRITVCALLVGMALAPSGCAYKLGYRHFAGPVLPVDDAQGPGLVIGDDRSITLHHDRLEVSLLPMTPQMLNRQFESQSQTMSGFTRPNPYETTTNPYTYGDWVPSGEEAIPPRFTVFLLKVKNYTYPKVLVDPSNLELSATNSRRYNALSTLALTGYYMPYAIAYAGNSLRGFRERRDLLIRTLYPNELVFSGQESEGFVVFPTLDLDVDTFTVWIRNMVLRFDYRGEPLETMDVPFTFHRDVYYARHPTEATQQ